MSGGTKFLLLAMSVLITVGLIASAFLLYNKGKKPLNKGLDSVDSLIGSMDVGMYSAYIDNTHRGSDVIFIIGQSWNDDMVEVVVNTADGQYLRYSQEQVVADGVSLTGLPTKLNGTNPSVKDAKRSGTDATATDAGYDKTTPINTPGYISESAQFHCTAQKDINGDIRRITFVQVH